VCRLLFFLQRNFHPFTHDDRDAHLRDARLARKALMHRCGDTVVSLKIIYGPSCTL
jgi:hypothetical protein